MVSPASCLLSAGRDPSPPCHGVLDRDGRISVSGTVVFNDRLSTDAVRGGDLCRPLGWVSEEEGEDIITYVL